MTWPPGSAATPRTPSDLYGFRLAIKTDLGSRVVRAWSIVPAAVNEREVAIDLLEAGQALATCWRTRVSAARRSPPS